ncbi:unnamed protein product [Calypogeia fissa]
MAGQETAITLTVVSASDLKQVTTWRRQSPYAMAYIDPDRKHKTKVADDGGVNPKWNSRLVIEADEQQVRLGRTIITLEIRRSGTFYDALIGTAQIPLANVSKGGYQGGPQKMVFAVQRPSGRTQGIVEVLIDLGVKPTSGDEYQNMPPPQSYPPAPRVHPAPGPEYTPQQPPVSYPPAPSPSPAPPAVTGQDFPPQGYPSQQGNNNPPQGYTPQTQYAPPQGYPPQQGSFPQQQQGQYYPQQENPPQGYPPQQQGSNQQSEPKKKGGIIGSLGGAGIMGMGSGLVGGLMSGGMVDKLKHAVQEHSHKEDKARESSDSDEIFEGAENLGDDDDLSF